MSAFAKATVDKFLSNLERNLVDAEGLEPPTPSV
jgi:hypothetical protein